MLETLTKGFRNARLKLQGRVELSEENISDALREVRVSLLEADVELGVVKAFLNRVKERSVGEVVAVKSKRGPKGMQLSPGDHFIKICNDELVALMGPVDASLDLDGRPAIIMMVGLQGSGKTTTAGKLARQLLKDGQKPMLVAADIYRPAAVDQLTTLGRKLGVPVFSIKGMDPVQLCELAVTQARNVGRDVVIFDTAGRLAIDNALMDELVNIKDKTRPGNILFVCDAMIGQDAVRTAAEFDKRLDFTGFILTKLDGDARGGAALSIKEVTGKPIKFLGMGEGLDKLEEFRPEGLASRILGFGDVVGLVKDFEEHIDQETAEKDAAKMLRGDFTFDDFLKQLETIQKMGSLKELFERLPFFSDMKSMIPDEALDDRELVRVKAMIHSMTFEERNRPDVLNDSRIRRIARGSGHTAKDVEDVFQRFLMAREMMKNLGASGLFGNLKQAAAMRRGAGAGFPGMMPGMGGMMPGMLPDNEAARPSLSPDEKKARRAKSKAARQARKKSRKKR
ncbi:MAG: signal recognition particle protein [Alphaproteobacteria bacterium]|nr:signal recognition particle protein [Alphaproteobacteria bacterium]